MAISDGATDHDGTFDGTTVSGAFVNRDDGEMYRISHFDRMPAFLMSIVSDSDHWMFVSSTGGLTAGRVEPERCLFPYETDDRLYRAGGATGPFTLLRVTRDNGETVLWEPFTARSDLVRRNLYKNTIGNSILFEEINEELGLTFRYRWNTSTAYGFVRTASLARAKGSDAVAVEILDGLLNVMPAEVSLSMQQSRSTLVEAYRRNEVDPATNLAIFSLEASITDRPEPAESLRANIAWSTGLRDPVVVLSADQIARFRQGHTLHEEACTKGQRGHYLITTSIDLDETPTGTWRIIADVYQSQQDIERLRARLLKVPDLSADVDERVQRGTDRLRRLVDAADANQCTEDRMATAHHFANTIFNSMRGGVFIDGYFVRVDDLVRFLQGRNRAVSGVHQDWLESLGDQIDYGDLLARSAERQDADLQRLCYEYLPLTFSRRHGDPSRPWNHFSIRVKHRDGTRVLDYQGNWRDIFQNWEALCFSFPEFLGSVIAKFVNASTVDGFNPYRIAREGIDWEVPEPDNAWSTIGYWGDHQIIYLLRLLEACDSFHPGVLAGLLEREVFSYADVPYRLRPYDAIVRNSKDTIEFDFDMARQIEERTALIGSDAKLLSDSGGNVYHVNLAEKLLVPALAKLANLVVDGGIWMNTQRPEWNDANNALVGNGLSMVTLAYLRRYLDFCEKLYADIPGGKFVASTEVAEWLSQTETILSTYHDRLEETTITDRRRKRLLDSLGAAFGDFRTKVYDLGFSGKTTVATQTVVDLCRVARDYLDHSIRSNRRGDGLYHSYNLMDLRGGGRGARVEHLAEMLEGQVAVISSGMLAFDEILGVVDALFDSRLFRPDQHSFTLYPARELPGFLDKNVIPAERVETNPLLVALLETGDTSVVAQDAFGTYRFSAQTNARALTDALDRLSRQPAWTDQVAAHRADVLDVYESVFHHKSFTGRSGSMYKYEGLGSVYWHMVAKLLLAVQEAFWRARAAHEPASTLEALAGAYYRVREGLSSDKTPAEYGAFPMDPYSHTPAHMGAQQPGMTGQVKEEILTRWGELGLRVEGGRLRFDPVLLRRREFLAEEREWSFQQAAESEATISLPPGSLGFTYCQVPVIYRLIDGPGSVTVADADGQVSTFTELRLDRKTSAAIFGRRGEVGRIEVSVPESAITRF